MNGTRSLKAARLEIGLSQEKVAARCGISQDLWSKYERGTVRPSNEMRVQIEMQLGAIDWFNRVDACMNIIKKMSPTEMKRLKRRVNDRYPAML